MIIILICIILELYCDGFDFNDFIKRIIRISNTFHELSFNCNSVRIFGLFIKGVPNFYFLESEIESAMICFDTWQRI